MEEDEDEDEVEDEEDVLEEESFDAMSAMMVLVISMGKLAMLLAKTSETATERPLPPESVAVVIDDRDACSRRESSCGNSVEAQSAPPEAAVACPEICVLYCCKCSRPPLDAPLGCISACAPAVGSRLLKREGSVPAASHQQVDRLSFRIPLAPAPPFASSSG